MFDPDPALDALLQRFLHPGLKRIDPSLERITRLLERLGSPHLQLPPVVHLAGTNGKGSTLAFLRSMLQAAGKQVHAYSSPHLVQFNERIMVANEPICQAQLIPILQRLLEMQDEIPSTFFEATTVAAFLAFAQSPADVVLLETGMGGRLDATNVVPRPAVSIITAIGMDHAEFLGDTVLKVAGEKAGIIKRGCPLVIAHQKDPSVAQYLLSRASEFEAPILMADRDFSLTREKEGLLFSGSNGQERFATLGLAGEHQLENAATALAALMFISPLTHAQKSQGLATAQWAARLQDLQGGKWHSLLRPQQRLMLDGAHNPLAFERLAEWIQAQPKPVGVVMGMLKDKDSAACARVLGPLGCTILTVPIPGEEAAATPEFLARALQDNGAKASPCQTLAAALEEMAQSEVRTVLICGSLYLAGWVLAQDV